MMRERGLRGSGTQLRSSTLDTRLSSCRLALHFTHTKHETYTCSCDPIIFVS